MLDRLIVQIVSCRSVITFLQHTQDFLDLDNIFILTRDVELTEH